MIHTNRIVTVGEQECIIDRPIVLYRGDREVEIEFTLVGNEFMFSEEGNVIKSVNASHGQLVLNTPSGEHMFSELAECHEGKVVFVVTKEMIDEFIEMGFYSFQIRLYDSAEMRSRVTIPPVMNGFDIRNPIAAEDETNVVDQGIVDYARIFKDQSNEELPTFTWDGEYVKTEWVHHDVITENKMNKIEDALYSINANIKESDVVMLNTLDQVKKDADAYVKEHMAEVEVDVEEFERNLNTDVQKFKVDTNAAMTAHKNEVSEELKGKANKEDLYLNVRDFGAKGDGVTDDREAIQNALDYIAERGGGCLYFPHPDDYYRIGSTVVEDEKNVGLIIKSHGVRIMGEHMSVKIQARAWMDALIYFPSRADRFTLEDITISGNYVVDYCIRTKEYCPYMKLDNVRFEQASNTAVYVYTYVSVLNKCIFASSPLGVHLSGTSNSIATSTTFTSCYAVSCTVGYKTTHATYCSFVSCACDHADIGYDITGRGIGMTGCGCESSRQPLKFSSFRGISINGFYMYNCGGDDENNKVNYLVEFVTGAHATISGLMVESCKNYNYKLGLTDDNYGYENITITDDCITKSECYSVGNWKFSTNPIKLLRNETTKNVTITCTMDQLRAEFDNLPEVINHDVTITISGGTTSSYIQLQNKTGRGRIILDLNGQDIAPTAGSTHAIRIMNMNVNMLIHNGTLSQTSPHNYGEVASVSNSGCIAFKNVAFKNITGNKGGAAVCCTRNAVVSVYNCTYSGWFGADNVYKVYHNDGSCITQGEITQQS